MTTAVLASSTAAGDGSAPSARRALPLPATAPVAAADPAPGGPAVPVGAVV